MAITYPLTAPISSVGMASISFMGETVSSISQSPFTFSQQIFKHPGERWKASVQLAPMKRQDSESWIAFLLSLKGRYGTFLMGDPNGVNPQGDVVKRNIFNYSEDYSNAYWSKQNTTVSAVGTANPVSGLPTGVYNIIENSDVSQTHNINRTLTFWVAGTTTTISFYCKQGSSTRKIRCDLGAAVFGVTQQILVDLVNGTVATVNGTATSSITSVGGGFYRVVIVATPTITASGNVAFQLHNGSSVTYNGDGTSFVVLSDVQVETNTVATDYQKTIGSFNTVPLVNGAGQTGNSLIIDNLNWSATALFKPGDYIQLGSSSSSTLYKVLSQVDSDAAGNATIDIFPSIRTAPADNANVYIQNTVGRWRLDTDITQWEINNISSYGMQFNCVEAI